MSGESMINSLSVSPVKAVGVVDFNAAAEAAMSIWIGGVQYLEANAEILTAGVWTKGANVTDSSTSFRNAVNGDLRATKPRVTAVLSAVAGATILVADEVGAEYNYVVTTDSAANCTVENMHGGSDGRHEAFMLSQIVTAQDILAGEVNLGLPFLPSRPPVAWVNTVAGLNKAVTWLITVQATPRRLRYLAAGATPPIATDVLHVLCYR